MSWFDEQLSLRNENDGKALNEAYQTVVDSIIGEQFSFDSSKSAIELILKFYRMPDVKLPEDITDDNEKLNIVCRSTGLMRRDVTLTHGWYKNAFGAFIAYLKDDNSVVALIPDRLGRYFYFNPKTHKKIYLNKHTARLIKNSAICFYKPLPAQKLSAADLIKFGLSALGVADYALAIGMMALATLVGLLAPKLSYFLYNTVVAQQSISLLLATITFIVCVNVTVILLKTAQRMFTSKIEVKMNSAVKSATMMRVLSLPADFFRQYSSGEIQQRMSYVESICTSITGSFFSTGLTSLFSLAYITQIAQYAPALVVPSLCIISANVLFSILSTLRTIEITKKQMEIKAKNSGVALSMISGVQKIKLSGSEKRMFARWAKTFAEETKVQFNPPMFIKMNTAISLIISLVGQFVLYDVAISSGIGVAEYYAFQSAYATLSAAITVLAGIALQAAQLKPALEMAKPILETLPEGDEKARPVNSLSGAVEINNVTFGYDKSAPNVIENFSLSISPGQYVAIVGKTGCGKSTLVRLLLGFEKPDKGAIYYDGKDLELIEKKSLRQKIGTVMQDDKLFMGDIYNNIVICAPHLPLKKAWEAARLAGIDEDIKKMPMGMNTLISDGSGGVSGGQRQRLLIARAIAPSPKILIFDEATSALDNLTQKKVSEALDSLNCTRIVIAHRLSTIRHCDRILVMEKGRIIEDGTYDELIEKNGYFAELVDRQRLDKED